MNIKGTNGDFCAEAVPLIADLEAAIDREWRGPVKEAAYMLLLALKACLLNEGEAQDYMKHRLQAYADNLDQALTKYAA